MYLGPLMILPVAAEDTAVGATPEPLLPETLDRDLEDSPEMAARREALVDEWIAPRLEDAAVVEAMRPGAADDFTDSIPAMLPGAFPKGYGAFYVMKRELTQGEYAAFLNSLTPQQQVRRNPALSEESPAQPGRNRYTISTVAPFFAVVPHRAANAWDAPGE